MRLVERVGDLDAGLQRPRKLKRALRQLILKRFSFEILHDQEVGPVLVPDVVQRTDVRVVETRNRFRVRETRGRQQREPGAL
jgi:hypothetical protein